jgi:hypothetical protein
MNLKAADVASTSTSSHQASLPKRRVESEENRALEANGVGGHQDHYIENIMTGKVIPKEGRKSIRGRVAQW